MRTGNRPARQKAQAPAGNPGTAVSPHGALLLPGVLPIIYHLLRRWKQDYAPKTPDEAFHPLFVEALQKQDHVEYLLDVLLSPDMEERAALIIDYGKEVSNLERRMAELAAADTAGRRTDHTRSSRRPGALRKSRPCWKAPRKAASATVSATA